MSAITLPPTFPVVGLGAAAICFLQFFQMGVVGSARKAAKVPYPNLYVSDADAKADQNKYKFNCAQRAHGNTLENVPSVIALFGFLSVFHPIVATSAVVVWVFGRVFYTLQYAAGNPAKRNGGVAISHYLGILTLLFGSLYVAVTKSIEVFA
ncbi:Microsomal glutathione S-transferase 3 [Vanrija pseudolonga]|uniref:Microsomal glutathione S-transferase 3 n=1 Tax=Vanrija pseudolonga TaxID=143232 RepID=A0AAF0Y8V3_9TREE|nr:Microsomal glutathione S-transferase 3 [Vanrija pseudolonga]